VDDNGTLTTVHTRGNKEERDQAIRDAAPWTAGNTLCLIRIINATPRRQIHLVKHALYAKDAWNSLHSVYLPRNSHHIQALTNDITTFRLTPGLDLREWIDGIEILYNDLCDLDSKAMSDCTFVLTILANISASSEWQEFGSRLRDHLAEYDNHEPNPIQVTPTDFIVRI
jgi:gag-polypeptide of LTR copia-type